MVSCYVFGIQWCTVFKSVKSFLMFRNQMSLSDLRLMFFNFTTEVVSGHLSKFRSGGSVLIPRAPLVIQAPASRLTPKYLHVNFVDLLL